MKISKGVITVHLKDLLKNLNHSKSTNSEFETITTFLCSKISFITIYMNPYIIEMPSFKYESLVRAEIINFLFNLIFDDVLLLY